MAALFGVACGSQDYGDPLGVSGRQLSFELGFPGASPAIFVIVADDSPAARPLREQLVQAFDRFAASLDSDAADSIRDPAHWQPIDRSVVVVHPSADAGARFSSPAADPVLRWREDNASSAGRSAWLSAVHHALEAESAAGAPFQALAAFHDVSSLLRRNRQPETIEEHLLLAALPSRPDHDHDLYIPISVAVATEDQSPGGATQYMYDQPDWLLVPAADLNVDPTRACVAMPTGSTPRYEGWTSREQLWPCSSPAPFSDSKISDEGVPRCLSTPIATLASGQAACVASVHYLGTEPCPADHGWLDPIGSSGSRTARVDRTAAGDMRVCEIQQLEGAALASCQSTLACTDCQPGWCATTVPELVPDNRCAPGSRYPPFRFVFGANAATPQAADVTIVCDEASAG